MRGALPVVVATDEEPRLSPDRDGASQRALGAVVVEHEPAVVEEAPERVLVADGVAERRADQAAHVADVLVLGVGPREERVDVRPQVRVAQPLDLDRRLVLPRRMELEDATDAREPLRRDALRERRLEELAAQVGPASARSSLGKGNDDVTIRNLS